MKPRHSNSLILVWRVAEFEAHHLNAATIEPTHLLLGLCKVVDLDLLSLVSKDLPDRDEVLEELLHEIRRVRTIFHAAGLDAKKFRCRLRHSVEGGRFTFVDSERMCRSKAAKQVFADAEHFAIISDDMVYPAHLLYAVLLAEDENRDQVLKELSIDKERLQEVAKREIVFRPVETSPALRKNRTHLN